MDRPSPIFRNIRVDPLASAHQRGFFESLGRSAAELALFAGAGFLLFGINDLVVDCIYFSRRLWRSATIYKRFPRAFASYWVFNKNPGFMALLVPAWDESAVIASMLRATLSRIDYAGSWTARWRSPGPSTRISPSALASGAARSPASIGSTRAHASRAGPQERPNAYRLSAEDCGQCPARLGTRDHSGSGFLARDLAPAAVCG
jgi:hypothetical protein